MKIDTVIAHAGRHPEDNYGIVNPPVYHASTVLFPNVAALEDAHKKPYEGVRYGRYGTPTTYAFEEAFAALEGVDRAIVNASGLSAITLAMLPYLAAGDHVLVTDSVYGPTRRFCDNFLERFGVETTYYDPLIGDGIAALVKPSTKIVYVESPGSLTFEMQDIPAIASVAHAQGAKVITDNTWATPLFFKPFDHGVDIAVYAGTKYIMGHSDGMIGIITCREEDFVPIKSAVTGLGNCAGPDEVFLALRGLRTLGVRLRQHQANGLALARWLSERPEVARVIHPGLPGDAGHDIWKRDFTGASGLFSMVLHPCPEEAVAAFLDSLELFGMGYSWGGFESLIVPTNLGPLRSATTWPDPGPLIRLHAGLEDTADLIADLDKGFVRLKKAAA